MLDPTLSPSALGECFSSQMLSSLLRYGAGASLRRSDCVGQPIPKEAMCKKVVRDVSADLVW